VPSLRLQAIFCPSGDQAGSESATVLRVSRRSPLPSALITKISCRSNWHRARCEDVCREEELAPVG
jgi:hypothetical protein